MSEAIITNV